METGGVGESVTRRKGREMRQGERIMGHSSVPEVFRSINVVDGCSLTNIAPPRAAMKGTDNCETAAKVMLKLRKAKYQTAYPIPEAIEPDVIANRIPNLLIFKLFNVKNNIVRQNGRHLMKFSAVETIG